ncbi:MAG TPA: glycosyltransferase family 2 protein [Gemmataceae bacterium]|nr:glycosyltransferase family 2 protein [Gemmataceae bacterium]
MSNPVVPPTTDLLPAVPAPLAAAVVAEGAQSAWQRHFLADAAVDVTVCIANWNCRDVLRACLESLHDRPQGVAFETIVVDNGSTDGAADMVAREFPEVVLLRNERNLGFSRANNQAARRARGRYLFFLNNDTVLPADTLRRLLEYAEAHPEAGMIGPRLRDGEGRLQLSYRQRPTMATLLHRTSLLRWTGLLRGAYRRYRRQDFDPTTTRPVDALMGAAVLLSRERFFRCGGWDGEYAFGGEDLDLSFRINREAAVVYHPDVEITHYGRMSTRQHIGYVSSQMASGFARYLRKCGYSRTSMLLYKIVVTLDGPVQLCEKLIQTVWRRLRGRRKDAQKSWLACKGLAYFLLRGLLPFWRA